MIEHAPPAIDERFTGCLLGLAVGDAVGTAVEFKPRGTFIPLTDMVGGGPFQLPSGAWTDDTSMALCLAESLIDSRGFHPADQMRRYLRWRTDGLLSSTGTCFDVGNTVNAALMRFSESGDPYSGATAADTAGNGSLMRLAPVVMWAYPDADAVLRFAADSSRTTHGATACIEACQLFGGVLTRALNGLTKPEVLVSDDPVYASTYSDKGIAAIAQGTYLEKDTNQIHGTGYVVSSLEAALWCFATTDSFRAAVLKAANLGDDADTTAAICGQVAGAFYGMVKIPTGWRDKIVMLEKILNLARQLFANGPDPDAVP